MPNHDGQCHYGVINLNSIGCDALGEAVMGSCYETWEDKFKRLAKSVADRTGIVWDQVLEDEVVFQDQLFDIHESLNRLEENLDKQNRDDIAEYKDDEIEAIFYHDHNNLMITSSKYKTRANLCSPCYPNAGDLNNCDDASVNVTYCLGSDWFEDGKMPYKILEE